MTVRHGGQQVKDAYLWNNQAIMTRKRAVRNRGPGRSEFCTVFILKTLTIIQRCMPSKGRYLQKSAFPRLARSSQEKHSSLPDRARDRRTASHILSFCLVYSDYRNVSYSQHIQSIEPCLTMSLVPTELRGASLVGPCRAPFGDLAIAESF